jgi:hypothetical protein
MKFYGTVTDGKFISDDLSGFKNGFKKFEGCRIYVKVDKDRALRSPEQNKYYWGVVIELIKESINKETQTDFSSDQIHEALKEKFLKVRVTNELSYITGSSELTTLQFMEYLEKITRWASVYLNLYIPEPNEELNEELKIRR